jgi:hypothetical protein
MGQKRCAIVGTAETWIQTPWDDPTLEIWLLNDCYNSGAIPRCDRYFDLHPFDQMYFRPPDGGKFVDAREVPPGKPYIRPHGHLERLQKFAETIPVYVQRVPDGWPPNAQRFPIEPVMEFMKARPDQTSYIASSPVMEIAMAALEGYAEIQIFGIHLATEHEYREQRPNFEWLLGRLVERGVRIVLPEACPILKHSHIYGYEPKPKPKAYDAQKQLQGLMQQKQELIQQLVQWPRWKSKAKPLQTMREIDARIVDVQQQIQRAHMVAA